VKTVFVDTSGFYAFLNPKDPFHAQARDCFARAESESWQLVTTNCVMQETWAIIQSRLGWDALEAWRGHILPLCEILWVSEQLQALGEARCVQARQRGLSLVDCISAEVMRQERISEAIAQDRHFAMQGISLP
jgi:predicted nucleic acid-binding protein